MFDSDNKKVELFPGYHSDIVMRNGIYRKETYSVFSLVWLLNGSLKLGMN